MRMIFGIYTVVCFLGCASPSYRISSSPGDVDVEITYANGSKRSLGKTPVAVPAADVNPNKESLSFVLKKEGYETQSVLVPASNISKDIALNLVLNPSSSLAAGKKIDETMNEIASSVADLQNDIQKKNFPVAEQKLSRLIASYSTVSAFHSLLGNVYYLQRRFDAALLQYKRALALNPGSGELSKIVQKLEDMQKVKTQ